jgi:hypothetical protein
MFNLDASLSMPLVISPKKLDDACKKKEVLFLPREFSILLMTYQKDFSKLKSASNA